jgi:hypothetical protein
MVQASALPTLRGNKADAHGQKRTSEIIARIAARCNQDWTVGDISGALGKRGFGLLLLIFTLPNTLPLPIPVISAITSLPLIFLAAQMCLGRESVWFPRWLAQRAIAGERFKQFLESALPWLMKLEKVTKPRAELLTGRFAQRLAGALIVLLACLIALPIPLGNLPLGIAMTVLALAVTERDGWVMLAGWFLTIVAIVYFIFLLEGYGWMLWQAVGLFA